MTMNLPIVVLISGSGSNLQALIDTIQRGNLAIELRAVVSNEPAAYGLIRAAQAGIPHHVLNHRAFPTRVDYDQALRSLIDSFHPELVVLAGFMRVLTPVFVRHYRGRLLNIHPSLLPHYPGLHTHARALADRVTEHGATVHFVTEELDGGPGILQVRVPVYSEDHAEILAARVLRQEHHIYSQVLRWFTENRVHLNTDDRVVFDGGVLAAPIQWLADGSY